MNSRERFLVALGVRQPDRVPIFEGYFNEESIISLLGLLRPEAIGDFEPPKDNRFGQESVRMLDFYCLLVEELALDATSLRFSGGLEPIGEGLAQDKYGIVYHLSELGEPMAKAGPVKDVKELRSYDMVSRLELGDFSGVKYVVEKLGSSRAHCVSIIDPFKASWSLMGGMENLLMAFILDPELVHALGRVATDFCIAAIDMALEVGADVPFVTGDLASEKTTLMSPEHYREYIKPYHKELVEHAHKRGVPIAKHSDGNVWPILEDLLDVGFDGIHPIQPQCMDIGEVKQYVEGRACLMGNIDCRHLLPYGTVEQVERAVQSTIEKAAPGGGYIMCSSNSIHPDCKPENYVAMVKATHEYGLYDN